jgi:hypothetical protein
MKRLKRSARRSRTYKSKPKAKGGASHKGKDANRVGNVPDFVFLPNARDQIAIVKLCSTQVGCLKVDLLVRNDPKLMALLRDALAAVYVKAAEARKQRRATKSQLCNATSALNCLKRAVQRLEAVSSDGRSGLRMLLEGAPLDDEKGERELNEFAGSCWTIRLDIVPNVAALESSIAAETKKLSAAGERQKRLGSLIEALASWWLVGGGKSLAPYVRANRRDGDRAVVHGRSGRFMSLAIALLCDVDVFKNSEVEAAVTNVHEARLATKIQHAAAVA